MGPGERPQRVRPRLDLGARTGAAVDGQEGVHVHRDEDGRTRRARIQPRASASAASSRKRLAVTRAAVEPGGTAACSRSEEVEQRERRRPAGTRMSRSRA